MSAGLFHCQSLDQATRAPAEAPQPIRGPLRRPAPSSARITRRRLNAAKCKRSRLRIFACPYYRVGNESLLLDQPRSERVHPRHD